MSLPTGTRLGPYEVIAALGAGGMGEVYRATDTRLGRDVAIKIASAAFSDRFEREARAVAALNHPHICTLHDVGPNYLVMELIDGETLTERVQRGAVPLAECVRIATQIAEALEAAHEKGIVHRDLKPGNVKIKGDGTVKVLDFGLAKAVTADATLLSNSPTLAAGATEAGLILGTAAYMSPEQARGIAVDKRSDIWAFGCVIFEMLTTKPAFEGRMLTDVLAAVIRGEPDWNALPAETPARLRLLLRRCLQKEPARRLHDIADARIELQDALDAAADEATTAPGAAARSKALKALPWVITGALSLALAWLATGRAVNQGGQRDRTAVRMELNLPPGVDLWEPFTNTATIAFAPDGSRIAFIGVTGGDRQIYVRRLDQFDALPVPGTSGANAVFFSPDSGAIGVLMINQSLQKVVLADGLVVSLARGVDLNAGATWGADDRITFGKDGVLWQVPASAGPPTQLTTLDKARGERAHRWPAAVGGSGAILFAVVTGTDDEASRIELLSSANGQRRVVAPSGTFPSYAASGHLIFSRDRTLLAVGFDPERVEVTGTPVRILNDVRMTATGAPTLTVSASGAAAYKAGSATNRLVWVSRQGVEEPLGGDSRRYANPRLARDGHRVVVSVEGDLWVLDAERATVTRLTSDPDRDNSFPIWTSDGKRVCFRTLRGLSVIDADGSGHAQVIPGTSAADYPTSVAPDGRTLLFLRVAEATGGDLYTLSLEGETRLQPLVATAAYEGGGQFSPDGRLLAYTSKESGQFQVFVRAVSGSDRKWVAAQSGKYPRWSPSGKELFIRDGHRMVVVDVSQDGPELSLSTPRLLFTGRYDFGSGQTTPNYDVSADGQRFLMVKNESGEARLNIVLNWHDELKRLVLMEK